MQLTAQSLLHPWVACAYLPYMRPSTRSWSDADEVISIVRGHSRRLNSLTFFACLSLYGREMRT